jgi:hypothetical protein
MLIDCEASNLILCGANICVCCEECMEQVSNTSRHNGEIRVVPRIYC